MAWPRFASVLVGASLALAAWAGPARALLVLNGSASFTVDVAAGFGQVTGTLTSLTLDDDVEAVAGLVNIDGTFTPGSQGDNAAAKLIVFAITSSVTAGLSSFLTGDLTAYEVTDGSIALQFGNLAGEAAPRFDGVALVVLTGPNVPAGPTGEAEMQLVAPASLAVPLPSSLSLLLPALALLGVARTRVRA